MIMVAEVLKISGFDRSGENLKALVKFQDDKRNQWIRMCEVTIYLRKAECEGLTLPQCRDLALDRAYSLLRDILDVRES